MAGARVWSEHEVTCIASGPSVTSEDIEKVRLWKEFGPFRKVVVTNNMFLQAPWADVLVGMDEKWWKAYLPKGAEEFGGERFCGESGRIVPKLPTTAFNNSGAMAISLSVYRGAISIILLGYDGKKSEDGRVHSHGDHISGLSNAKSMPKWGATFQTVSRRFRNHRIVNCSRDTVFRMFPQATLEQALGFSDRSRTEQIPENLEESQVSGA